MLVADGGGYAGTTNWNMYNVEQMWALLENQKTDNHWKHVTAWQKAYELTSLHMWRLKEYRDSLAAAWPPEKSQAARVFIDRLDNLINHIESTYEVASENYTVFKTATSALADARRELKEIYDEYVEKKKLKKEYEERLEFEKASLLPGVSIGNPPVTDAELEDLNNRARSIMFDLSSTLVEARIKLRQPEPYDSSLRWEEGRPASDGGGGTPPPVIPSIVPIGTLTPSTSVQATVSPVPPTPPTPPTPTPLTTVQNPTAGPVLGGVAPVAAPPTPTPTTAPPVIAPGPTATSGVVPPPTMPIAPNAGGGVGGAPRVAPPGMPSSSGAGGTPGVLGGSGTPGAGAGAAPRPGAGGAAGMPRVMPPGGLIGGAPGAGLAQPAPVQQPRRVNPVGGVIGAPRPAAGAGAAGAGAAAGHPFAPHMARPGQAGRRREDESTKHWDPDTPWETDQGVDPVVQPAKDTGPVDPGPAIGLDR